MTAMDRRPVILCAPVRNELHNLARILPAWSLYADHIVVADQGSWDGTRELLASHPKVRIVANPDTEYSEPDRIRLMLAAAREVASDAVLLFLDADETLSANVLESIEWRSFLAAPPGTTGYFKWVWLWRSIYHYVAHGNIASPTPMPFAFVDDGRPFDADLVMHGPRGPGMLRPNRVFHFNDVVNLHFNLVNPDIHCKKQNWYKLFWLKRGGRYYHINRNHSTYHGLGQAQCEPTPSPWHAAFAARGIDLISFEYPALTWYDVEILQHMHDEGYGGLWLLDIWNQDWEHLRQLALAAGHCRIPGTRITPPPRSIRAYNDLTLGRVSARRTLRSAGRFLKRTVLP